MPSSAAGPFRRRTSSPGAQPACLSIAQPALPRPSPPPPPPQGSLQSCFSPPAPQGLRGLRRMSGAAPGALPPTPGCLAAPAIPRQEGRKEVLNHRPPILPGPAPQVAKARARTQPACHAAILYLTGRFLPACFGPKRNPVLSTASEWLREHITF